MRNEIKDAVAALADEDYQNRAWLVCSPAIEGNEYDFDMACHALLDDIELTSTNPSLIGDVLRNSAEVNALVNVADTLLSVISEIGRTGTFEQARSNPRWPEVVAAARQASDLLGPPTDRM